MNRFTGCNEKGTKINSGAEVNNDKVLIVTTEFVTIPPRL
jgi:hypothetical protein